MRIFDTGATRDDDEGKLDYIGFLCPMTLERYAKYMHKCRLQADGNMRSSDNWKCGISQDVYIRSMARHFMAVWRDHEANKNPQEDLCALLFNVLGYLREDLLDEQQAGVQGELPLEAPIQC